MLFLRSSWGATLLAATEIAEGTIVGVLVALIVAAIVGLVLWVLEPTRPFAGPVAILTFLVLLLLLLL
jgi:hypothetical protein